MRPIRGAVDDFLWRGDTTGTNYNFVAVNDQLQFGPSDPIIIALLSHVKK